MRLIWIFLRLPLIGATIAVISTPPKSAELVRPRSLESIDRKQIFTSTSRNSTGFPRLPTNVVPNYYVLHLDVALKSFSYTGIVTINVDVLEKTKTIKLHSNDTEMVWVTVADGGGLMDSAYYRRGPFLVIVTKKPLMKGPATIQMKFRGKISRTELTGFYASSYNNYYEVNRDGSEFVALTQFEPTGARTTFPCFDEPGFKARFDLKINVDSDYPVDILSNMPSWYDQNSTTVDKTFRRTKWFQPTPVMSTYLLAFAIGRFECLKSHSSDGTPVRVCTRPGESSKARLSLDATVAAFDYFTDLFGVENGIRKVDVLAVPRFSAGAMENWGLITGRQSIFAPYLDHLDTYKKHLLINIVAHEVVHFWFGNLVTMKWWEQLWIKEATSSYFETPFAMNFVPEERSEALYFRLSPERRMMLHDIESAFPIQRSLQRHEEIDDVYDLLTYNKGSAVARMIRNYVNSKSLHEDLFLKAVRLFLRRYQHQSVEAKDFWKVFQEVTGEDTGALFSGWFTKPGFPLITVQQNRLVQERFLSSWNKHESTTPWKIPVEICQLTRKSHPVMNCTEKMTINDKSTILTNHEFSMLNPELAVYYIIKYEDEDHFQKVLESSHEFSEVGRYYFLRDVEFLVRHSHYYMDRLLTAIDKFRNDRSYLVQQMVMEMEHYSRVMKEGGYPEIARFAGLNEHGFLKR